MTWVIDLTASDQTVVADFDVTLVFKTADGKEERFGPAHTDSHGRCLIAVGEQRLPLSPKAWRLEDVWLEVQKGSEKDVAHLTGRGDSFLSFALPEKKKPNQALEPTALLGRGSS